MRRAVLALMMLIALPAAAAAEEIQFSGTVRVTGRDVEVGFLQLFDSRLGTLRSATFDFAFDFRDDLTVRNYNPALSYAGALLTAPGLAATDGAFILRPALTGSTATVELFGSGGTTANGGITASGTGRSVATAAELLALTGSAARPVTTIGATGPDYRITASDGRAVDYTSTPGLALTNRYTVRYTYDAAAVPEPASWAMMIVGVGAAGGMARRRGSGATRRARA